VSTSNVTGRCFFGSRTQGTARRYSDLDIGLAGEPLSAAVMAAVGAALEESDLPYRVDVVNLSELGDEFRAQVFATAVALERA